MDPTTILAIAIVSLSAVLVVVGTYSVFVLRDMRESMRRVNKILGRVDAITEHVDQNIIRPSSSLAGVLAVLRDGAQIVHEIKNLSDDVTQTAKVVNTEVKQVSQVVREDLVPAVSAGISDVGQTVRHEAQSVASEITDQAQQVVQNVASSDGSAVQPEPMKVGSLSSPRRRFFSRRK